MKNRSVIVLKKAFEDTTSADFYAILSFYELSKS